MADCGLRKGCISPEMCEELDRCTAACPKCGYTSEDCATLMDHHLCGEPAPASPAPAKESATQPKVDAATIVRALDADFDALRCQVEYLRAELKDMTAARDYEKAAHERSRKYYESRADELRAELASLRSVEPAPRGEQDYKALYHELLYQVGKKWEGETRHQTALRYLRRAEETKPEDRIAREGKAT